MTARWRPGPEHRGEATQRLVAGLTRGDDIFELAKAIADLHPRNNTFPGEVFISIAVAALDAAGINRDAPLLYEGLREKHLAECRLRGRDNKKIQFAVLAIGATRGGIEPDLLDEVVWWQTDDFWWFALAAAVAVIRSCADHLGEPVPTFVARLTAS
ncbi:MAG TPA: hypothetical protein VGV93_00985 [Acidimicrobiales bacterium]|nr:hypothetical protein [Acidimicrobiales bacterium]